MRRALAITALLCLGLAAADLAISKHGYFAWEDWPAGQGLFGFAAGLAVVLVALGVGRILRRPEDYYDE